MTRSVARPMTGEGLARTIIADAAARAHDLRDRLGVTATLATVLVGDDPASVSYVRMKRRRCEQAGIGSRHIALPTSTSTAELVGVIVGLSADPDVHGVLLQHPVGDPTSTSAPRSTPSPPAKTSMASPRTRSRR